MSDLAFEKWFSSLNAADFPMDFLARLNGEYCNPATRTMLDMYMANVGLEQVVADRDAEIVRLRGALGVLTQSDMCDVAVAALQPPEEEE